MTVGLELVQWALWWMAEQRRQYILNMRKALYYLDRRLVMSTPSSFFGPPRLPARRMGEPGWLTRRQDWKRSLELAEWKMSDLVPLPTSPPYGRGPRSKLGPGW